MRSNHFYIFLVFICIVSVQVDAIAQNICDEQNLGWHFYCDPKKESREESQTLDQPAKAEEELASIKSKLESLKTTAFVYPTPENLKNYIAFQKEQMDKAEVFSNVWRQVVWQNPELDYLVKRPNSTVGNELNTTLRSDKLAKVMQAIKERYGIFFFYDSGCLYCRKYSPILKAFINFYDLKVFPVSMDGIYLPEWPESIANKGEAEKLGLSGKPVPATVLFDSKNNQVIPLGFGLLTIDQLEERLLKLINDSEEVKP